MRGTPFWTKPEQRPDMERLASDLLSVVRALVREEVERSKEDVLA